MSARSRARKNKRRNIVAAWDLIIARTNHNWANLAKKSHKVRGLYPIMFNPRASGRTYNMHAMLEALDDAPFQLHGFNGKVMEGALIHPTKVENYSSILDNLKFDRGIKPIEGVEVELDVPPHIQFMRQHPPIVDPNEDPTDEWLRETLEKTMPQGDCISRRSISVRCESNDHHVAIDAYVKKLQLQMGLTPEMLEVNPDMLGRKHGEFGGLCAPIPETENMQTWTNNYYSQLPFQHADFSPIDLPPYEPQRYASLISPQRQREFQTPQHVTDTLHRTNPRELVETTIPFEAKSIGGQVNAFAKQMLKNIDSIEDGDVLACTATELVLERLRLEKEEERTLKDIAHLQSLMGTNKPFDDFYLKASISVYEIWESCVRVQDDEWLLKPELRNAPIDQLKTPHKSGPFLLAVVSANESEECRIGLENYGYVKVHTRHQQLQFVPGEPVSTMVNRYFLIVLDGKLKSQQPRGFTIHSRTSIVDLLMRTDHGEF